MTAQSLCDTCRAPGACCSGFTLSVPQWNRLSDLEVSARLAAIVQDDCNGSVVVGVPFAPAGWRGKERTYVCTLLQPDGRCGDYAYRPKLCKVFEPGTDPLCVEVCAGYVAAKAARYDATAVYEFWRKHGRPPGNIHKTDDL